MIQRFLKVHGAMIQRKVGIIQSVKSRYESNFPTTDTYTTGYNSVFIVGILKSSFEPLDREMR